MPQGKALDIKERAVEGSDARVVGTNDYKDTAGSDVVVITAGIARKPGMSRDDLLNTNYKIVKDCTENVLKHSPNTVLIVVSNPLDAMCQVAYKVSGLPKHRVFGMAGVLDSARMRSFIAHGAGRLGGERPRLRPGRPWRHHGAPAALLHGGGCAHHGAAPEGEGGRHRQAHGQRRRRDRVLLKTGSAYYAPSASAAEMVDAVLKDKHKVLPCCCYLEGEFGIKGLYVGVPAQLGAKGVEKIWQIKLTADEKAAVDKSAAAVKELVGVLKL